MGFIGPEKFVSVYVNQVGPSIRLVCPLCGSSRSQELGDTKCITVEDDSVTVPIHGACGHNWSLTVFRTKHGARLLATADPDDEK